MTDISSLFPLVLFGGIVLIVLLTLIEIVLYYRSWGVIRRLKDKLKASAETKDYAAEGALSLVNLAMTLVLNLILLLVMLLCFVVLAYSIIYLTDYFFIILAAVVLFLILLIYICIWLTCMYNRQKGR